MSSKDNQPGSSDEGSEMAMIWLQRVQQATEQALDLLFPPRCACCKRGGSVLCSVCLASIRPLQPPLCSLCGHQLAPDQYCHHCRFLPLRMSGLRAFSTYQEPLRSCIHALKYDGNTRLAKPLGSLLAQTYLTSGLQSESIVPVPLHSERQRKRGYNQAQLLAETCASLLGLPLINTLLIRSRETRSQIKLTASERQQNVTGAFLCNPAFASGTVHGRKFLLIDDVCTTGATLEACAAPLFAAGASAVWGLTLAHSQ